MIVRELARRLLEQRSTGHFDPYAIPPPGDDASGVSLLLHPASALRLSAVYACVGLITDDVAGMPIDAFTKSPDGRRRLPIAEADAPSILREPHDEIDLVDWVGRLLTSLLMRGDSYGLVTATDARQFATQVLPITPDLVGVRRDRQSGEIVYSVNGEQHRAWPLGRMWHTRGLTLAGELCGLSPIEHARRTLTIATAVEDFGSNFFADGAHPSGALTTDEKLDGPTGEQKAKRIMQRWRAAHASRHRNPALLSGGMKWEPISVNPNEAQFLETREFETADIARLFRVPPHMIGAVAKSTSWGTGIEQQHIGYLIHTLNPWIVRLQRSLRRLIPSDIHIKLNPDALLRTDIKSRYEAYAKGRQGGWLSTNKILELEDEEPVEGGDVILEPLNMRPAGQVWTKEKIDAVAALVRAGFEPAAVLDALGLPEIPHEAVSQ